MGQKINAVRTKLGQFEPEISHTDTQVSTHDHLSYSSRMADKQEYLLDKFYHKINNAVQILVLKLGQVHYKVKMFYDLEGTVTWCSNTFSPQIFEVRY